MKNHNPELIHVLQTTGVLKNFTVIQTLPIDLLHRAQQAAKSEAKTDEEYLKLFRDQLNKHSNINDPIPGTMCLSGVREELKQELQDVSDTLANYIQSIDGLSYEEQLVIVQGILRNFKMEIENVDDDNDSDE